MRHPRLPRLDGRHAVLIPALLVGACAVAATAHGGYEVAVASQVPEGFVAGTYPVITDGLALVAYAATHRLTTWYERLYAWTVVVLAAALSGLAQAVYLASGPALDTSPVLRFGVGAWPAVAGAVAAHLVYLLARRPAAEESKGKTGETLDHSAEMQVHSEIAPEPERAPLHSVPTNADPTPAAGIPVVAKVSPARTKTPTSRARVDDVEARAAQLIADGAGRNTLVKELGVTPHRARTLLEKARA